MAVFQQFAEILLPDPRCAVFSDILLNSTFPLACAKPGRVADPFFSEEEPSFLLFSWNCGAFVVLPAFFIKLWDEWDYVLLWVPFFYISNRFFPPSPTNNSTPMPPMPHLGLSFIPRSRIQHRESSLSAFSLSVPRPSTRPHPNKGHFQPPPPIPPFQSCKRPALLPPKNPPIRLLL